MRIHHSAPYDPAGLVNHTHRRPLETNVQSCKHPHRCSPSFARGITSGKGRLPAGEQQPHVWDVLYRVPEIVTRGRFPDGGESDSTWRTQEARHVGSDTIAPGF